MPEFDDIIKPKKEQPIDEVVEEAMKEATNAYEKAMKDIKEGIDDLQKQFEAENARKFFKEWFKEVEGDRDKRA